MYKHTPTCNYYNVVYCTKYGTKNLTGSEKGTTSHHSRILILKCLYYL